ncbi:hypothetical protein VTI74DRAFT_9211 [Chaetomium olivicolor]
MATTISTATDPQLNSKLARMPLEILLRITYFIRTEDLANVRLSCKALERSVFNAFSYEFFRKKQFMVSTFSLQALIDIARHPILSPVLKHVIICTDRLPANHWAPHRDDEGQARFEEALADHMHLLATGGLRDMLAEAFSHLPNLETVDIRDFHSPSRNRDGRGTPWTSYGSRKLFELTNCQPSPGSHRDRDPYVTELFCAATAALASSQARPKSVEVLIRSDFWRAWGLHDAAFYIPPRMEAPMAALLENLKSLHLSLHVSRTRPLLFQKFLSLAPHLTWLRLNFSATELNDARHLFSWLALKDHEAAPSPIDRAPIPLQHLERLDLGSVDITPELLLALIAKFAPTLTSLYLRRVCMVRTEAQLSKTNSWLGFLSALPNVAGSSLRVVDLSEPKLTSTSGRLARGPVLFKTQDPARPLTRHWACSTRILTLEKATAQAAEAMHVDWPAEPESMDEDESENEEEEDEEGESDQDANDDE